MISEAIDEELLTACPDLKVASNVAVGFNNIDVAAATRHGVVVTNTPDVLTETTADFAWTLLMAIARRVVEADRYVRDGKFDAVEEHAPPRAVTSTARLWASWASAESAAPWPGGRRASACASSTRTRWPRIRPPSASYARSRTDIATLLKESDFVTLHTPLLPETRHLINASRSRR